MTIKFNHPHMKELGGSDPDKVLTAMQILNRITLSLEAIDRTFASVRDHNEQTMGLKLQAAKLEEERAKAMNYTNHLLEMMAKTLVVILDRVDALPLNPPGKDTFPMDKIGETEKDKKFSKSLLLLGIPILLKGLVAFLRSLLLFSFPVIFMGAAYYIVGELFSIFSDPVVPTVPTPVFQEPTAPPTSAGFTFDITTALSFLLGVAASYATYVVQVIRAWNRPEERPNDLPPVPHHPIGALALPHLERAGAPALAERVPVSEFDTEHLNRMARDESVLANLPEDQRSYFTNILKRYNVLKPQLEEYIASHSIPPSSIQEEASIASIPPSSIQEEASPSTSSIGVEASPSTSTIGVGVEKPTPIVEFSGLLGDVIDMMTTYSTPHRMTTHSNPLSFLPPENPTLEISPTIEISEISPTIEISPISPTIERSPTLEIRGRDDTDSGD